MQDIANFLDGQGRLTQYPVKRRTVLQALAYLAGKLEAGRSYSEGQISELLNLWHCFGDPATLRREMCGYGLLTRTGDGGSYRRAEPLPSAEALERRYIRP